jgi:hypothetical protein
LQQLIASTGDEILVVETEAEDILGKMFHPHLSPNMLKMYYKLARLEELIREAERHQGETFSHVIWTRPDCEITGLAADSLMSCLRNSHVAYSSFVTEVSFGDYVMVLPRKAFAAVSSVFQRVALAGDSRLLPWRPNREMMPGARGNLAAFGGPDVLFDVLISAGYTPLARIPRMTLRLVGRTPSVDLVRKTFAAEQRH